MCCRDEDYGLPVVTTEIGAEVKEIMKSLLEIGIPTEGSQ